MSVETSPVTAAPENHPAYWGAVYAMALCSFVLVAAEFMPVSLLTPMATDLRLTEGQAGQTVSVCSVAALVASLTIRKLAGSVDRRLVLLFLTALLTASGPLVASAPNFIALMSGRVLVGIALGGFWSLSAATAMRLVPARSVPKALAVISSGTAIAGTIAAPLGSFLGGLIGWRGTFFCIIPIALAALLWQAQSLPCLPTRHRTTSLGIPGLLRRPPVAVGFLGAMVFFAGQYSMFTYLRPFLEQVTRAGLSLISLSLLVIGVMGFVGTLLVGRVIGNRLHLTLAVLASIMAIVALGLTLAGRLPMAVLLLLAAWGFCGTAAQVTWWAWVTRATADDAEAGGGLLVAVAQIGITSGATLGGLAFDSLGPVSLSLGSGVTLALAAVIAIATGWLGQREIPRRT
ncbi:MFS transporter [Burkholderia aenigmatica]|uniref:MFS transporter n=1 Tax=Burkholderia aenigmatica TaxID=2015348 RepID=UPI002650D7BF|nr:MFS transporter [Burkholderia aenigmatica]MDN7874892.1 MFS transporter [Burkholderia aenigmatica]